MTRLTGLKVAHRMNYRHQQPLGLLETGAVLLCPASNSPPPLPKRGIPGTFSSALVFSGLGFFVRGQSSHRAPALSHQGKALEPERPLVLQVISKMVFVICGLLFAACHGIYMGCVAKLRRPAKKPKTVFLLASLESNQHKDTPTQKQTSHPD